jgi:hypothetical protein
MRFNYLLYPEAFKKIKNSGIEDRVNELKKSKEGLDYIGGHFLPYEIVGFVKDLKERGYYNHFPKDFSQKYKKTMNGILNNPEKFQWTIQRTFDTIKEPCDLEDLLLFSGDLASRVLKPEEIWDYSKFGFTSPSEFVTTVGTYVLQQSREIGVYRQGYTWTRKRENGSEIITEITGDTNSDLRIYQTDIAPYPTKDPFDNSISMRPETDADRNTIAPYHSTEGTLLVAVMKYIEQQDIKATFRKDGAKQLIKWGRSLEPGHVTCTEHFGGFNTDSRLFFCGYEIPLPQLDENSSTEQYSNFWLSTTGESGYGSYVDKNGDFVLAYQTRETIKNPIKPISARFLPDDAEHLVKGLIYQSAKMLGRTSVGQLINILEYRFSDSFLKE